MYVHPHSLQEVLQNLLWRSRYHSVPAKDNKQFILTYLRKSRSINEFHHLKLQAILKKVVNF